MATLQTADGRFLRSKPAGVSQLSPLSGSGMFPPMWSDGERWTPEGPEWTLASHERIYRSQPAVSGAVDKLARRIATLPFDAYQRKDKDQRELVQGDTLDSLIHHPVPGWSGTHLIHAVAQSLLVHGNAVVAKLRTEGPDSPPGMLWPLSWAQINAYAHLGGFIEWWSTTQFGQERFLAAADVMHFSWWAPSGQVGVSPLEKLGTTLKIEDAAQRHQVAAFKNGNRPSLAVSVPGEQRRETLERVEAAIEAMHRGPDNSAKTMMLSGGATATPLSLSPVEASLIDQRRLSREEVGMVYDLAGPLNNDLTHGTYNNVEELLRSMYRDVIPPWLALICDTFQTQLLDQEPGWVDRLVAFDLTDKLKGEPEQLALSLKLQVESGLITRNEARRILNLPPVDDPNADELTVQANNTGALSDLKEYPLRQTAAETPPPQLAPKADTPSPPSQGLQGQQNQQ